MYVQFCMYATTLENSEAVSKSSLSTNFLNIIIFGRDEFIPRQAFGSQYWQPQTYNRKKRHRGTEITYGFEKWISSLLKKVLWNNFKHNIKWKFKRVIGIALFYAISHQNKTLLRVDCFLNKILCLVKEGIMETQATIIMESNLSRY